MRLAATQINPSIEGMSVSVASLLEEAALSIYKLFAAPAHVHHSFLDLLGRQRQRSFPGPFHVSLLSLLFVFAEGIMCTEMNKSTST